MDENSEDLLDSLRGIPSKEVFEKLLSDSTFVDYFNAFLSLPVFGKRLHYNRADDQFNIDPPPPRTCYHVLHNRVKKWVRKERMRLFWKTDLFLEYKFCVQLHNAADSSSTSVDLHEARTFLGTLEDMCRFQIFLRGTAGHKIMLYWIDAERYRWVTKKEHRRFAYREIQAKYLQSGSPMELPESLKCVNICGPSFKLPKSVTEPMHSSGLSIFSESIFIPGQKMAMQRLSSYWLPKFIQHKKIIRKLIAEKRGVQSEHSAVTRRISPVPEDNPVSKANSEQEMDDFMEAQCVSSTESVTDEEIRTRKLEEWKSWFWEGTDSRAGSETKIEPPENMPMELRQLGGIREIDTTSAPPSSPVSSEEEGGSLNAIAEQEEDEYFSDDTDAAESLEEIKSISFTYPSRHRLVTPEERSNSEPALPTYYKDWSKQMTSTKPIAESEETDSSEAEKVVDHPLVQSPYAQIPTSTPRKLKTLYEALASDQSVISGEQYEELYGSSSKSASPRSSSSESPPPTVIMALRRASASRVIPLEDIGHEIISVICEPRAVFSSCEFFQGEQFFLPKGNNDMSLEVVALALTSDKLAGGPLREHLEKTQEHLALRSLQFWEDAQRYLLPPENVSSYGKYHSAKTLIATYIAPDSPREMSMSPQVRADLIRLLPEERGDHLLSTVVKTCIEAIASPWSEYVRSDEDHFVNCVVIRRKSANKKETIKADEAIERAAPIPTWQAFKMAVGLGLSGFSFVEDDDDKDEEREALEENIKIPSLKETEQEVRERRASHYYGYVTKQGDDTLDGNKAKMETKIRPPKPRCFNDVLHDTLHLMCFKRFLSEKNCEAPLLFWQAVENMKTNCKDGKARQARAMIITRKYFINIPSPAVEYLHCKADIIRDIPLMDKTTPPLLVSAQACVARSMEENWYSEYVNTFPEDEIERENFSKYATRNTLAGLYRIAAHGKTKGLWAMFAHNIMCFQRGIHNPSSLGEFKQFLKKESKATVEQNLRRHAAPPTRRMINNQFVNTDRLISDLEFWMEVERFKDQAENAIQSAKSGNYTMEDENLLLDKAKTIVKCYIDSDVPPRVQINAPNDLAENIVGLVSNGIVERGLFHEAAMSVFTILMFFWKKFFAEKLSKPPEEPQPTSPAKKNSSKKRIMSFIGGMPYRKLYVPQLPLEEELLWSFSLSHGLRLTMPQRFVIAKRVSTRHSEHRSSATSMTRPAQ